MANVFIGIPHHSQLVPQALPGLILATQRHRYHIHTEGGSLLALMFNLLWCKALNARKQGVTHFAMHHSDIQAAPGWVDVLLEELERTGADVLATVIPIKDRRGLTSTGWQDPVTKKIRRFTMAEVCTFPATFSIRDTPHPGHLMVNTGLWVCDITRPWAEEVCFHILDAITCDKGTFWPRCIPEDWNFSAWCAERGLKVFATRQVQVVHYGPAGYANGQPWGEWATDQGDYA